MLSTREYSIVPDSPHDVGAGVPGILAALLLAFLSNLFGSITHYGSGQVSPAAALAITALKPASISCSTAPLLDVSAAWHIDSHRAVEKPHQDVKRRAITVNLSQRPSTGFVNVEGFTVPLLLHNAQCTSPGRYLALPDISRQFNAVNPHCAAQGAVYIGSGYLALPDVFKYGALFSVINLTLWATVGTLWWKTVGLY